MMLFLMALCLAGAMAGMLYLNYHDKEIDSADEEE